MTRFKNHLFNVPRTVTLGYLIIGSVWVYYSDPVLEAVFPDPDLQMRIQACKGWFFILSTAVVLFIVLKRGFGRLEAVQRRLKRKEERLRLVFEQADDGIVLLTEDLKIVDCNRGYCSILGVASSKELIGRSILELSPERQWNGELTTAYLAELDRKVVDNTSPQFLWTHVQPSGKVINVEVSRKVIELDGVAFMQAFVRDVTDRIRQEEISRREQKHNQVLLDLYAEAQALSDDELYDFILEHAVELTGSTIGFLHLVSEDQQTILVTAWSAGTKRSCSVSLGNHYPLSAAGNWLDSVRRQRAVIYNDYPASPNQKGFPEGHVPVSRLLSVPVIEDGKVKIVLCLGNKVDEYDELDSVHVQLVVNELYKIVNRRRLTRQLMEREAALVEAQRIGHLGSWVHDIPSGVLLWSEEIYRIFGVAPGAFEPTLERWLETVPPDERAAVLEVYQASVRDRTGYDVEHRIILPDGSLRHVHERGQHEYDEAGAPLRSIGTVQDITEYTLAREAEQRSVQQYRQLFDNMFTGFAVHEIICDEAGNPVDYRFLEVNGAFEKLTGCVGAEVVGKTVLEVFPSTEPYWIETYGAVALSGTPASFENYSADLDRYFQVWAYSPQPGRFAAIFMDSTEHRRQEEEIRQARQQLQYIIDNTLDIIFQIDLMGNFIYSNAAAEGATGYSHEQLMGMNMLQLVAPEYHSVVRERLRARVSNDLGDDSFNIEIRRQDGGRIWFELKTNGVCDESGNLVAVQGVARDISERRRMEEALRESENLRRTLVETIPDLIWLKDPDGIFLSCNQAFERFLGASEAEIVGKTDYDFVSRSLADFFRRNDRRVVEADRSLVDEERLVFADGGYEGIFETIKTPMKTAEGQLIGVLGIARDISVRKQMEKALEKQIVALTRPINSAESIGFDELFNLNEIQHLQDVFSEATNVASLITLPDGTPITRPSNFTRLCREIIRPSEKGGINCLKSDAALGGCDPDGPIVKPCLRGGLWDAGACMVVGGKHVANWLIGQVRDGTQTEENLRAYARESGIDEEEYIQAFLEVPIMSRERFEKVAQALFTLSTQVSASAYMNLQQARFIADEKKRNEELRGLSAAINQAVENVIITDASGLIQYVNPAFESTTGYSRDEVMGKNPSILKSGLHSGAFYKNMWDSITTGSSWSGQIQNRRKDGAIYIENATISPVTNPDGAVAAYVAVKHDITKELRLEDQFRQAQKMEAVGRLASGIAHDFNNILQTILGFSGLLMMETEGQEELQGDLLEIQKAARRAGDLIRQLLTFSRKQPVMQQRIDVNQLITNQVSMLCRLLGENYRLVFDPDQSLKQIKADPAQLEQVIMNLVVNARDAMPEGGRITLATKQVLFTRDDAVVMPKFGEFICLTVTDTGVGIDKEVIDHLFEPFFTTKPVGQGTGLGLAVTYGVVEQHRGWVQVESQPNQGATFKVYLPVCDDSDAPDGTELVSREELAVLLGENRRVLLVEDDPHVCNLASLILREAGYRVASAMDMHSAQELFGSDGQDFDLLLLDVVLPDGSGVDLADELAGLKSGIPVVVFSGYSEEHVRIGDIDRKGYYFMRKPFSAESLLNVVNRAVKGRGPTLR